MQEIATKLLGSKLPGFLEKLGSGLLDADDYRGDLTVVVMPEKTRDAIQYLKHESSPRFEVLMDLFAVDYLKYQPPTPERFAVIYNLVSLSQKRRVRLKVYLPDPYPEIDSIHDLFASANWFEREAFDLYGIGFRGHPNPIRILCHGDFEGHPLRKDYPSDGYQRLKTAAPPSDF